MDTPRLRIRSEELDRLRSEHQLVTLRALAEAIDYDPGNLSRVLRGEKGLGVPFIVRLCAAFGVQPGALFEIDYGADQTVGESDPHG